MGSPYGPVSPASVVSQGQGILWTNPGSASGAGVGTDQPVTLTNFQITSGVVTFTTVNQNYPLVAGQSVTISGLTIGTSLNGLTLVVLSTGLSLTSFQANVTLADTGSTFDVGVAIPTTSFASAQNVSAISPPAGQYVLYTFPDGTQPAPAQVQGGCFNLLRYGYSCTARGGGGVNGCGLAPTITYQSTNFRVPSLPSGAVVQGIYPVANPIANASLQQLYFNYSGGQVSFAMDGTMQQLSSIGTDTSVLSSSYLSFKMDSSVATAGPPYTYWSSVPFAAVAVVYSFPGGGTPIPTTQLQTLVASQFNVNVPAPSHLTGVEINFSSGELSGGGVVNLSAQLTLNGTPIGTSKPLTIGAWNTSYTLGGDGDTWGAGELSWNLVNGSTGLGVNITGTLADGTQVNLNQLQMTVFYLPNIPRFWINVGNTRTP